MPGKNIESPEAALDDRTAFAVAEVLARVGRLWDRGSEKTLRKLIKAYGLADALDAARSRQKSP